MGHTHSDNFGVGPGIESLGEEVAAVKEPEVGISPLAECYFQSRIAAALTFRP